MIGLNFKVKYSRNVLFLFVVKLKVGGYIKARILFCFTQF